MGSRTEQPGHIPDRCQYVLADNHGDWNDGGLQGPPLAYIAV